MYNDSSALEVFEPLPLTSIFANGLFIIVDIINNTILERVIATKRAVQF